MSNNKVKFIEYRTRASYDSFKEENPEDIKSSIVYVEDDNSVHFRGIELVTKTSLETLKQEIINSIKEELNHG